MQPGVPSSGRTCVLVLGMHRSGTSAITRVLSLLGAALPRQVMPPAPNNNPLGFWEPLPIANLHDRLLAEAGSSWDDWRRFEPEHRLPPDRLADYRGEMIRQIEESYGREPLIVLKEPRICRFVPLYREILGSMGIAVRPVLALRDPAAVVASLKARDAIPEEVGRLYWLRHLLDAEAATRDLPRAIISYESLLDDWRGVIRPIASVLGIAWPRSIDEAGPEIDVFLSRDHDHASRSASGAETDGLPDWFQRCADALRRLPAAAATADLDALAAEFEPMSRIFGPTLGAERVVRKMALATQTANAEAALQAARAETSQRADEARRLGDAIAAERAARRAATDRHEAEAAAAHAKQLELAAELDRLRADAALTRAESRAVMARLRAEHEREIAALLETFFAHRATAQASAAAAAQSLYVERYRHANVTLVASKLERELQDFERVGLRWLFKRLGRIRLRTVGRRILPRPMHDLTVAGEDHGRPIWRITGNDPQFDLDWGTTAALPAGHYRLTLVAPHGSQRARRARLYVDAGAGYTEAGAIDLTFVPSRSECFAADFVLPRGTRALRLDPSGDQPVFVLGKVRLRRRSRLVRGTSAIARAFSANRRHPLRLAGLGMKAAVTLLTGGPKSLAALLREAAEPAALPAAVWEARVIRLNTKPSGRGHESPPTIAVHAHVFYIDLLNEVAAAIAAIPYPATVFVSTTTPDHQSVIEARLGTLPNVVAVHVHVVENRGRDLGPMLLEFGPALAGFDLVAHLHTKRSPHNLHLRGWRRYLFDAAFGSEAIVRAIVGRFLARPELGLLFPATFLPVRPFMRIGANGPAAHDLLLRCGNGRGLAEFREDFFPAGSVFWCRGSLVRRLLELQLGPSDFEPEAGQVDGTLAHALERILPAVAAIDGQIAEEYVLDARRAGESPPSQIASATDLIVLDHDFGGGTRVFLNHAVHRWLEGGLTVQRLFFDQANRLFVLQSADPGDGGVVCLGDLAAVRDLYRARRIGRIIVNSLVAFPDPEACIDLVRELKDRHGAKLVYHVHDFYATCPSQHLLNAANGYCGVPEDLAVCAACALTNLNMWKFRGPRFTIAQWRQAFQRLLDDCDEVVVFDESSIDVIRRSFSVPADRVRVRPHERTVSLKPVRHLGPAPLHIGVIGTLNHCKGVERVNELARHLSRTAPGTPLTLVGSSVVPLADNVKVTGAYEIPDLPKIIAAHGITVFLIASIVPETFCYTLDELMAMELPVVAFDLGAQGRRTAAYAHGTLLPADCSVEDVHRGLVAAHEQFYGAS